MRMTGCWVELQLENTELAWPLSLLLLLHIIIVVIIIIITLSDRDTVSEAEQSGGRDRRGRMSSTRLVWPGDTLHLHSAPV